MKGWEDYQYWLKNDKRILERINKLIKDVLRSSFKDIVKLEPLKINLQGFWSRRIDDQYRLIYKFESGNIFIVACKEHY